MRALTAHPLKPGQQLVILSQVGGLLIYASYLEDCIMVFFCVAICKFLDSLFVKEIDHNCAMYSCNSF